jgi:hypothetical protein
VQVRNSFDGKPLGRTSEDGKAHRDHDWAERRPSMVRNAGMRPHEGDPDTAVPAVETNGVSSS